MNDDRDADLAFALLVLPLAVVLCVVVWAAIVWTFTS